MTHDPQEQAQRERFELLYRRSQSPVMLRIERRVCGCDYGANSWTTQPEARQMAARLGLRPGVRLLDVGAGSGWPGLYLSQLSGCEVVLADLPLSGLRLAAQRAVRDGLSAEAAVADAATLPFADNGFDAISHSDLLCCLRQKREVLAECRRVVRPSGRMAFTVIGVAPGLSAESYRRAVANGPEFIETAVDYPTLLAQTGWLVTDRLDLTEAYADSCRRQLRADEAHRGPLVALLGTDEFAERLAGWRAKLAALEDGLLQRERFVTVALAEPARHG